MVEVLRLCPRYEVDCKYIPKFRHVKYDFCHVNYQKKN